MGNHRADVGAGRPSVTSPTYVGRRRAAPIADARLDVEVEAPYVGKRRATPTVVSETAPLARAIDESHALTRDTHETTDDPRINTGELRALVQLELTDTAPQARVPNATGLAVPGPRRNPEPTLTELPRLSVAATYATNLTAELPAPATSAGSGGRRRAIAAVAGRRRPSMPLAVGALALLVAAGGAAATAGMVSAPDGPSRVVNASALGGSAAVDSHGSGTRERELSTSRSLTRSAPAQAADLAAAREKALDAIDNKAEGQDKLLKQNLWGLPMSSYRLTATFGEYGLWSSSHTGLDFAAPSGTPIVAVARGTVTSTEYDGAYGNKTVVTLEDGTELWYCHQTSFGVSPGDEVDTGDTIGYVGSTGNVTGPHLHLEVRPGGGDPVDPYAALVEHGVQP